MTYLGHPEAFYGLSREAQIRMLGWWTALHAPEQPTRAPAAPARPPGPVKGPAAWNALMAWRDDP